MATATPDTDGEGQPDSPATSLNGEVRPTDDAVEMEAVAAAKAAESPRKASPPRPRPSAAASAGEEEDGEENDDKGGSGDNNPASPGDRQVALPAQQREKATQEMAEKNETQEKTEEEESEIGTLKNEMVGEPNEAGEDDDDDMEEKVTKSDEEAMLVNGSQSEASDPGQSEASDAGQSEASDAGQSDGGQSEASDGGQDTDEETVKEPINLDSPVPVPPEAMRPPPASTIQCFLCGGVQPFPGPRFAAHLRHEHGIVYDIHFFQQICLFRQRTGSLPSLEGLVSQERRDSQDVSKSSGSSQDQAVQTQEAMPDEGVCMVCQRRMGEEEEEDEDEDMNGVNEDEDEEDDERQLKIDEDSKVGSIMDEDTKEEYSNQETIGRESIGEQPKPRRRPIGSEWAPNSFSSMFTCYFCNEQFRKDYKLKLHLMMNHKHENPADMAKAKEELTKSKLDGCVHMCAMCGSKYNSVANFTRHIKEVHNMSRVEYRQQYGSSEVVSKTFKCELCEKEIKHTRNIIGAHMKMVHLISWREYQEILIRLRQGESVGDLPAPELFECAICGVSVKYKREHLNKKHQITEDVYDELIARKDRGEDISNELPTREIYRCLICDRECMDIRKHVFKSHGLTQKMYEDVVARNADETKRVVKQGTPEEMARSFRRDSTSSKSFDRRVSEGRTSSPSPTSTPSSSGGMLSSTDLRCYFGCDEHFKKDYQLYLHLKLRHRSEDPEEVAKAYDAAEEEIALTRRSGSLYECALCKRQFNDNGAFYGHIQTKHGIQWKEYKERFGRCEIESQPFECKICKRVVKYDRNTVHTHLKNVHGINWAMYLDRIRKLRRGEEPAELPQIEMTECRVCNVNVKYLKDHLRNAHKITEQEYESLFEEEDKKERAPSPAPAVIQSTVSTLKKSLTQGLNSSVSTPLSTSVAPARQPPALAKPPKSDIADKTNKRCSSCNIAFDSRRSFIQHCTHVHEMKFKTKSGMIIEGPSSQGQQQKLLATQLQPKPLSASGKRPSAPSPFLEPPRPKVSKMETKVDNQADDDTNGSNNERQQYTPGGVSKWNQCRYECVFCKKSTMSRSSMTSHIHNSHGIPIKEYKESSYPDIEVETHWFQCRLCPVRTKFVKDCIAPHLKMTHNMEIEVYERDYMQPEDWPQRDPSAAPIVTMREQTRRQQQLQLQQQQQQQQQLQFQEDDGPSSPGGTRPVDFDKWNQCKFRCILCAHSSLDARQIRAHIASSHGMTYEAYVREYGTAEVVTKHFRCLMCQSEMKHVRQNIYAHMKDVHRISLQDYEDRVGEYDGVAVEDVPGFRPGSAGPQRKAPPTPRTPLLKGGAAAVPNAPFPPPAPVSRSATVPELNGVLDNGNPPSRWNRCRFQCALCCKLSSEKRHVREHIIKHHGLSMQDYEARFGDCEIHTEYFFCGICQAEVKHNLKNISLHLNNVHHMSPQQYEEKFGRLTEEEVIMERKFTKPMEDTQMPLPPPLTRIQQPKQWKQPKQKSLPKQQHPEFDQHSPTGEAGFGFGAHFLLDEGSGGGEVPQEPQKPVLQLPPRADVVNPKNKHCRVCRRDFVRRQGFIEHCRTVHAMKIKMTPPQAKASPSSAAKSPASASPRGSATWPVAPKPGRARLDCEYCGKVFSNRSNRNRHIILSCEAKKASGATLSAEMLAELEAEVDQNPPQEEEQSVAAPNQKTAADNGLSRPRRRSEMQTCPHPGCDEKSARTAAMKRHLLEAHNGEAPVEEGDEDDVGDDQPDERDEDSSGDERRVPPLRVKLSNFSNAGVVNDDVEEPTGDMIMQCESCDFETADEDEFGAHGESCLGEDDAGVTGDDDDGPIDGLVINEDDDGMGMEASEDNLDE